MTENQISRIAAIIATYDVRDPRNALDAIAEVINGGAAQSAQSPKVGTTKDAVEKIIADLRKDTKVATPHEDEPVFTARIFDCPDSPGPLKCKVAVEFCREHIQPRHIA